MTQQSATPAPETRHPLSDLDRPVLPSLAAMMKFDLAVNERSEIWLVHDTPFRETVKWAEYDADLDRIVLVLASGRQQDLGLTPADSVRRAIQNGRQLYLVRMQDGQIADCGIVPFIIRGTTNREKRT